MKDEAMKPLLWGELSRGEIEGLRDEGALPIIPLGAIEQHAEHLPVDTDATNAFEVAKLAAAQLREAKAIVLPVQSYAFSPHHKSWPGTVSLSAATLTALLIDIGSSLHATGFRRMLFVNGHGGNTGPLLAACNSLICDGVGAGFVNYFDPGHSEWVKQLVGSHKRLGHACEYETSLQMALRPERAEQFHDRASKLTPRLRPPFGGASDAERDLLEDGLNWAWLFNDGDPGYFGDPSAASASQGRALLDTTVDALASFIDRFAMADLQVGERTIARKTASR